MRVGSGPLCRSANAHAFDFVHIAERLGMFMAQQFYDSELAINVRDKSEPRQLATGVAGAFRFEQCASDFLSDYQCEQLFPGSSKSSGAVAYFKPCLFR